MSESTKHAVALVGQAEKNATKWDNYECTPAEHLLVLTEELGEVARAMQGMRWYTWPPEYNSKVYEELVDLGAVVLAMMENCSKEAQNWSDGADG